MPVSKQDITWAFQIILGREPREQAITSLSQLANRTQLVDILLSSEEAKAREESTKELNLPFRPHNTGNPILDRRIILGKSMPRSGHHFLERLLLSYLENEFSYCEMYNEEKCCRLYPCSNPWNRVRKYHFQKSHDWDFSDRTSIATPYIIQYRSPIPRSQSNYELYLKSSKKEDTKNNFRYFLKKDTNYFIKFYRKWISNNNVNFKIITYEELTEKKMETLSSVLKFIGEENLNEEKILLAIEDQKEKYNPVNSPQKIRKSQEFRHFDKGLYAEEEERIKENCPNIESFIFEYI